MIEHQGLLFAKEDLMLTGVLVDLVPFTQEFLDREREWRNGPQREWWGEEGLFTASAIQRQREWRASQPDSEREKFIRFGLRTKEGVPIGSFALVNINAHHRIAEVGAGIGDSAYWSGGFGSDAMLLITDFAFRWLDLRRLYLTTQGENLRAQRQVEKCGFIREGSRRQLVYKEGRRVDFLFYGLLRDEWPGRDVLVEQLGLREKALARGWGKS
jgi:RimJ/RimL family protein N-acetyltransferase